MVHKINKDLDDIVNAIIDLYYVVEHTGDLNAYQTIIDNVDHALVTHILNKRNGNQSQSANDLGISRTTLRKKMRKMGLLQ